MADSFYDPTLNFANNGGTESYYQPEEQYSGITGGGFDGYGGGTNPDQYMVGGDGSAIDPSLLSGGGGNMSGGSSTDYSGLLSSLVNSLGGAKGIGALASGAYGAYAANQQGKDNSQLAQELLNNADPYRQYRQQAEIPFMLGQMQQYGDVQNAQNNLMGQISNLTGQGGESSMSKWLRENRLDTIDDKQGGAWENYNNQLQQSYSDPMSVYNSAGYQGLADKFGQQIARRDAAAGRNSQYGTRAVEMQNNFLDHLKDYRSGLNSAAGTAGQLQTANYGQALNAMSQFNQNDTQRLGGLTNLFGGLNTNLHDLASIITPRGTAGNGATTSAQIGQDASGLSNSQFLPLISGITKSFGG